MRTLLLESPPLPEDWAFVWDEEVETEREISLTEEEIKQIAACAVDARYFIQNFCWLECKEIAKILQFIPFDYQWDILDRIQAGESLVINKSRRVGVSWSVAAYVAWLINFHEGVKVLLLSKREDDAKSLLRKVKFILNNLAYHDHENLRRATSAKFLRGEIGYDNQQLLSIVYRDDNGDESSHSEVASLTMTTDSGRSEGATFIFWDETAFAKPDDEATWSSIRPTVMRGGQYVIASTPNGVGGVFWQLVRDGQAGINLGYEYKEVHWSEAGITYEQVMEAKNSMKMTEDKFLQEFELSFAQPGMSVFSKMHLDNCYRPLDENPSLVDILIKYDEDGSFYFSGIDSATGQYSKNRAPDYNSFVALTNSGIVAGVHQDRKSIGDWAGKLLDRGDGTSEFIEGETTRLHRKYPGVSYVEKNNSGYVVVNNHKSPDGSRIVPKSTTKPSKVRIINNLALAVEGHRIIITDPALYLQMHDYMHISGPGTYGPPAGGHDDMVMALAWAYDSLTDNGGKDPPMLPAPSPPNRESATGITPREMRAPDREFSEDPTRVADMVGSPFDLPVPEFNHPEPEEAWYG
jgi:hypothetical protein